MHEYEQVGIIDATLLDSDPRYDVAMLSFDVPFTEEVFELYASTGGVVAEMGDSNNLSVGDMVFAVGSPLGIHNTVTLN